MKSYKASCDKEAYVAIKRTSGGKYVVRWNPVESTEGEGESARVIVTYNEAVLTRKPSYGDVVTLIIRDRYEESDELAMARQSYADVQDYMEYNAYVEQCKKWAAEACGIEYTPVYAPTQAEVMSQLRTLVAGTVAELPDEKAVEVPALFDPWKPGEDVVKDTRRYDNVSGKLYKCIQPHKTQAGWEPHATPALWAPVSTEEWPEWVQPLGSEDAYAKDSKVSHNEKHWTSDVDNNIWEPGVYGWTEVQ